MGDELWFADPDLDVYTWMPIPRRLSKRKRETLLNFKQRHKLRALFIVTKYGITYEKLLAGINKMD